MRFFSKIRIFTPIQKKSAENGDFLQFRGFRTAFIHFLTSVPLQLIMGTKSTFILFFGFSIRE